MAGRERGAARAARVPAVLQRPACLRGRRARLADVDEHDRHHVLGVRGKGETEANQRVPLNVPTIAALERWQVVCAAIAGDPSEAARLPQHRSAAHTPGDLRPDRSPREGRRRRPARPARPQGHDATLAHDTGMPLRDVQDSARHANPRYVDGASRSSSSRMSRPARTAVSGAAVADAAGALLLSRRRGFWA
jgi:hypothetical protein